MINKDMQISGMSIIHTTQDLPQNNNDTRGLPVIRGRVQYTHQCRYNIFSL